MQITVTFAKETRVVECENGLGDRAFGIDDNDVYGVFPTGKKAHRAAPAFWAVDTLRRKPGYGAIIGTDETGREWMLDLTLYTHNRNVGRIVGWADSVDPQYIARW